MKLTLVVVAAFLGCLAIAYYFPEYGITAVVVAGVTALLALYVVASKAISSKGGLGLWFRWVRNRLRPVLTAKGKRSKAEKLGHLSSAIDKAHKQRQREQDRKKQIVLGQEVVKMNAFISQSANNYTDYTFVDLRFMDKGAYFCVTDDLPYPHQDIYAIYAEIEDHGLFRKKVSYYLRKGQMLEDKEVFPAHITPRKFPRLKKAMKVLDKELRTVVGNVASRARPHT